MPFVSDAQRDRLLYFANYLRASVSTKEGLKLPIEQRASFITPENAIRYEIREWTEHPGLPRPRLTEAEIIEVAKELPHPPAKPHFYMELERLAAFFPWWSMRSIKHTRLKAAGLLKPRKLSPKQRRKAELSGALVAAHLSI